MRLPDLPPGLRADPLPDDDVDARARATAQRFDARLQAEAARLGNGLSPISQALAFMDWAMHLASQPAQRAHLALSAQQAWLRSWTDSLAPVPVGQGDPRFADPGWQAWPWRAWVRSYQAAETWWAEATSR